MIQLTDLQKLEAFNVGSVILTKDLNDKGIICQTYGQIDRQIQEVVEIKGSSNETITSIDISYSEMVELLTSPSEVLNFLYPLKDEKYIINQIPESDDEREYIFKKINFED